MLSDDHPLVDVCAGGQEERAARLKVVQGVRGRDAEAVRHDGPRLTLHHRATPGLPALEEGVQQTRASRGREELSTEPDETAARHAVLEARTAVSRVAHLGHAATAGAHSLGDDTDERFGDVDDHVLDRLALDPVDDARDHLGVAELHLVALAPHRLDEDRELQLTAAEQGERIGRVGLLEADREVLASLADKALADLTAGQVLRRLALAGERGGVDPDLHLDRRLLDDDALQRPAFPSRLEVDDRIADVDVLDAGDRHDLARRGLLRRDTLQPLDRRQDLDRPLERGPVLDDADGLIGPHRPGDDATDREATRVVVVVEVVDDDLQRRARVPGSRGDVLDDEVEERLEVRVRVGQRRLGDAQLADGVDDGEIGLGFAGLEVAEEIEDLVQDFGRSRVGAVDLVDDDDDRVAELKALSKYEARLRERTFGCVDEEESAVGHEQRTLDLSAEVGVARGVDDVDLRPLPANARVLRQDRDAALALQIVRVHHAVGDDFVVAEGPRLAEHVIDQRGLPVVDVRHDGDIAKRFDRHAGVPVTRAGRA